MGRVIEMPLPRLGETMEEGRIGLIVKKPGEAFLRGEERFDSLEALIRQMDADQAEARRILSQQ